MDKFFNRAIIGNKKVVASFTEKGELQRFCYPVIDGRQFVDFFHIGLKINDSNLIYLHDDINNKYNQEYVENTNVLVTKIDNLYFKLTVEQTDCMLINNDIMVKKYTFKNNNSIPLDVDFIVNSKILSNSLENYGSRIFENGIVQYNHNFAFSFASRNSIYGHRLNDVGEHIAEGVFYDKDYIGMSNEVAISFKIGVIKPKECVEFSLFVWASENKNDFESSIYNTLKVDEKVEIAETIEYWKKYVKMHNALKIKDTTSGFNKRIMEIYTRTILLYPLLINYEHGGVAAALEVDDERCKSGGYRYCWPRDAIFITEAFDLLKMRSETEMFYNKFCRETQSKNGMWEQRFYTDGRLAPCWGYQIDETASVVYGVYKHYKTSRDKEFLKANLKMCESAIKFLMEYIECNIDDSVEHDVVKKEIKEKYEKAYNPARQVSYDIWEMHEGVHLYSLCSIIASFKAMKKIYATIQDESDKNSRLKKEKLDKQIQKIDRYSSTVEEYITNNLIDEKSKTLKRNTNDNITDISVIGAVYPFNIFDINDRIIKNTIDRINMTLRTYKDGYLRFENDSYMQGKNPWGITTLWMAMYYIKAGEVSKAKKCFKYVVNTSAKHGFLSEQVNNEDENFQWVIGLGWSHAMFIIVLNGLLKLDKEGEI